MKVSISISDDDVAFLDEYARERQVPSRSAVVQRAIRALRAAELTSDYAAAFDEWHDTGEADAWDGVASDGLRSGS